MIETFAATSLLEVRLVTGKRNQIRLQARLRGHTLVGEQRYVYGPGELRPIAFARQALHAYRLTVKHPINGRPLQTRSAGAPGPGRPHQAAEDELLNGILFLGSEV